MKSRSLNLRVDSSGCSHNQGTGCSARTLSRSIALTFHLSRPNTPLFITTVQIRSSIAIFLPSQAVKLGTFSLKISASSFVCRSSARSHPWELFRRSISFGGGLGLRWLRSGPHLSRSSALCAKAILVAFRKLAARTALPM